MDFFTLVDAGRERWNVLQHPFYLRWSAGDLSPDELALYAGQYRHAVQAVADASEAAREAAEDLDGETRTELAYHALEEAAHVELWDEFASAAGASSNESPLAETEALIKAWASDGTRDLNTSLAVLYAIEVTQPSIAETKAAGLIDHYGFKPGSSGVRYFDVHMQRDAEHAAQGRALLEARIGPSVSDDLAGTAISALQANWTMLDGVERLSGTAAGSGGR